MASFDVYTATASELQELLKNGTLSSQDVLLQYLQHVQKHEGKLHELVEVAPEERLLSFAKQLDDERAKGLIRGPLHGIPIIVKACDIVSFLMF